MKTVEDYLSLPYAVVVTPDEDMDGNACYRAEHPQLPGCMSHGKTPQEAAQNLADARRLYIQTRLELGLEVPVPAVITSGTNYPSSSIQTWIVAPVIHAVAVVPAAPSEVDVKYKTDLPSSYDVIAQQAA